MRDALTNLVRQPARTLLCTLGTVVAVAAIVTTNGLTNSAQSSVSSSFNVLRATTVEFQAAGGLLTNEGVERLDRLNGVRSAGLMWDIDGGQPVGVGTNPQSLAVADEGAVEGTDRTGSAKLSFAAASPATLKAIGAKVSVGRLYDEGADRQRQMVALLGSAAAQQLGISSTAGNPAIFVGQSALTVVGIVDSTEQESQVLLGVIVPPYAAAVISGRSDQRRVIARTAPGAAQLIGRQGPLALAPYDSSRVAAEVPPDPSSLREQVESSLSALLLVLAVVGVVIGFLSIMSVTTLAVAQRRSEIGLRRAVGYQRWDIARLILAETAAVGVLGGVIGASLGVLATSAVAASRGWTPVMAIQVIMLAPLLGVVIGVLAGIYPSARAMRVTPLAALRAA